MSSGTALEEATAVAAASASPPHPPAADTYTPRAILLTGGAGFIGSNVLLHLAKQYPSYTLVCLDKLDVCSSLENLRPLFHHPRFHFVRGDICNASLVRRICQSHDVDTIMHFASQTHVDNSFGNSLAFTYANVQGTHTLLECAVSLGGQIRRFIHVSTDEVYGGQEDAAPSTAPFSEKDNLNPTNPYAATKAAAEFLVKSYRSSFNVPTIITRGNNVYGPRQYPEKLVPKFTNILARGLPCPLHGDGKNRRSFLFVEDVCRAFDVVLHRATLGEIYNIGCDNEYENVDILRRLISIFRQRYPQCLDASLPDSSYINYVRDRAFNDFRYHIDSSAIHRLGWSPIHVDIDDGLTRTVEWYMQHPNHWENVEAALAPHPYFLPDMSGMAFAEDASQLGASAARAVAGSDSVASPLSTALSVAATAAVTSGPPGGLTMNSSGRLMAAATMGPADGATISALRRWSFSRERACASLPAALGSPVIAPAPSTRGLPTAPFVYENQRYLYFKWRAPYLPTDRWAFSNEAGTVQLAAPLRKGSSEAAAAVAAASAAVRAASPSAVATAAVSTLPYVVVVDPAQTDADGWSYALDFPTTFYPANYTMACVRRRLWRRIDVTHDTYESTAH